MGYYIFSGCLLTLWIIGLAFSFSFGGALHLLLIGAIVVASLKATEHVRT